MLGWDQCQARTWDAIGRHTALAALAQLRDTAIRNALCGDITLPPAPPGGSGGHDDAPGDRNGQDDRRRDDRGQAGDADPGIPLGDAPVPARPGQPCPPGTGAVRLTVAETARLIRLARQHAEGHITRARLAFHLRWSRWRRRHQARARWHHYATRLAAASHLTPGDREGGDTIVTANQNQSHHSPRQNDPAPRNRDCTIGVEAVSIRLAA